MSTRMAQVEARDLTVADVNRQVIVTVDGNPVLGRLTQVFASSRENTHYREPTTFTTNLWIELVTEDGIEVKMRDVPLDYLLQVDRATLDVAVLSGSEAK